MLKKNMSWVAVLSLSLILAACAGGINSRQDSAQTEAASIETSAYIPKDRGYGQIAAFSVVDLNGESVDQTIFHEKPVTFINYWATWCGPCRAELPDFPEMYEKYKDKVTFVTIVDDGLDNATAKSMADQYLEGYVNLLPSAELVVPIQTGYVPTSAIVDAEGYLVVDKIIGAMGDYSGYIDAALEIVGDYAR